MISVQTPGIGSILHFDSEHFDSEVDNIKDDGIIKKTRMDVILTAGRRRVFFDGNKSGYPSSPPFIWMRAQSVGADIPSFLPNPTEEVG